MPEPIKHRFYHEVVSPLVRLQRRCAENVCVQAQYNDVVVLAQEAATAAYHFPEALLGGQGAMKASPAEALRQKLSDVVDSRKHGKLRNPDRQTELHAALAYEFNEAEEFRYLGTIVTAENLRFGTFNLGETVELFAVQLRDELGIPIVVPSFEPPQSTFGKAAVAYVTDKTFFAANTRIQFHKRATDGRLTVADPKNIRFEVHELK